MCRCRWREAKLRNLAMQYRIAKPVGYGCGVDCAAGCEGPMLWVRLGAMLQAFSRARMSSGIGLHERRCRGCDLRLTGAQNAAYCERRENAGDGRVSTEADQIEALKAAARESGLTIDLLQLLTQGLSRQAFRRVMGNASSMPSYMKSIDKPYLVRRASAPSSDRR